MKMLKTIRDFCDNQKLAKKLDSIRRVSIFIAIMTITGQALVLLFSTPILVAEENPQQILVRQLKLEHHNKYDLKLRETLSLQKDFGNPASALETLDHLFEVIKGKVKAKSQYNKEEAIGVLKTIGNVLKEEGNFEYGQNRLLIEGLEKQKNGKRFIDCDDYSSIYLAAAETLGLFLEPVYAPSHIFLRCRLNDRLDFYWEPTLASEKDIYFYRDWLNLKENSGYPKVLNEEEFDSIQFCNLGLAWYENGDYEKAIEYYKKAIDLNSDFVEAFNNLGVAYAKQGNYGNAIECYKNATLIDPNYATPYNNIGVAFYKMGYLQEAVDYFEKAIEADPKYKRAYGYKVAVLIKKGDYKKVIKFLKQIRK